MFAFVEAGNRTPILSGSQHDTNQFWLKMLKLFVETVHAVPDLNLSWDIVLTGIVWLKPGHLPTGFFFSEAN